MTNRMLFFNLYRTFSSQCRLQTCAIRVLSTGIKHWNQPHRQGSALGHNSNNDNNNNNKNNNNNNINNNKP